MAYKKSSILDKNGVHIKEGDIISADGYYSDVKNGTNLHCVEYHDGVFGSDIYSDFEPLFTYNEIEIVGHCEAFRDQWERGEINGNIGQALKPLIEMDTQEIYQKKSKQFIKAEISDLIFSDKYSKKELIDILIFIKKI